MRAYCRILRCGITDKNSSVSAIFIRQQIQVPTENASCERHHHSDLAPRPATLLCNEHRNRAVICKGAKWRPRADKSYGGIGARPTVLQIVDDRLAALLRSGNLLYAYGFDLLALKRHLQIHYTVFIFLEDERSQRRRQEKFGIGFREHLVRLSPKGRGLQE